MANRPFTTTRGFARTGDLLQSRIRRAAEGRGFAVARVVTHWAEVVGEATAALARPVDVKYGREGFGATLTLLCTGPNAPLVEMQKEQIRDRVNAAYGYRAIQRVRITQTAPTGFAEAQADYDAGQGQSPQAREIAATKAQEMAQDVENTELRLALEGLATEILSKRSH